MRTDIRKAILAELRRREISANRLAEMVADHVHRSHVYDFLAGRKDLSTAKVNHLLIALDLAVMPRSK